MHADSTPMHRAYLALGSNLGTPWGDPAATIQAALQTLAEDLGAEACRLEASSLYATEPVGLREQPSFINGAASVLTSLSPEALLQILFHVEQKFGRKRSIRNGPRTLDLDLLMVDDLVLSTATLVLPHPSMAERRFVLAPLVEIAPGLVHPVLRKTMAELLALLPEDGEQAASVVRLDKVRRLNEVLW